MALWGKKDKSSALTGTFTSTGNKTITTSADQRTVLPVGSLVIVGTDTKLYRVTAVTVSTLTVHANCAAQAAVQGFSANPPKFLSDAELADVFFVDSTEAAVASNRAKGVTGPGWWLVKAGTGGRSGRFVSECLVPMAETAGNAGDREDAVIADS